MANQPYDPVKAHDYYERTKKLKGKTKSPANKAPHTPLHPKVHENHQRVIRIKGKVAKLQSALSEAEAELSKKRQSARKTEKHNSDGKTTVKERQSAKESRDKHQTELKTKEKRTSGSSGGGSSKSSSKSVSDMSAAELRARIIKIKRTLRDAKQQLSGASNSLGQLAHSAIVSIPNVDEQFARFQSAERMPSK